MMQLDLFENTVDPKYEISKIKNEWEKTRRSLYAKNAELTKTVQEISHELQVLKLHICKGRLVV